VRRRDPRGAFEIGIEAGWRARQSLKREVGAPRSVPAESLCTRGGRATRERRWGVAVLREREEVLPAESPDSVLEPMLRGVCCIRAGGIVLDRVSGPARV